MRIKSSLICAFAACVVSAASQGTMQAQTKVQQASPPAQRVRAFLRFHLAHDTGFTTRNLEARKAWLAPTLYRSLQYELKRQTAFQAKNPDEVPFINGDVFTSSQEKPTGYRLLENRGQDVQVVISDGESLMKTLQRPKYMENTTPAGKHKTPG
jgi:hypothetical protein